MSCCWWRGLIAGSSSAGVLAGELCGSLLLPPGPPLLRAASLVEPSLSRLEQPPVSWDFCGYWPQGWPPASHRDRRLRLTCLASRCGRATLLCAPCTLPSAATASELSLQARPCKGVPDGLGLHTAASARGNTRGPHTWSLVPRSREGWEGRAGCCWEGCAGGGISGWMDLSSPRDCSYSTWGCRWVRRHAGALCADLAVPHWRPGYSACPSRSGGQLPPLVQLKGEKSPWVFLKIGNTFDKNISNF